jgi:hypothetical protein
VIIPIEPPVIGIGDHPEKKQAERLAALAGVYQLHDMGVVSQSCLSSLTVLITPFCLVRQPEKASTADERAD